MTRALVVFSLLLSGCGGEDAAAPTVETRSAAALGRVVFESPAGANHFACATCHRPNSDPADLRILPGAVLAGVVERPTFWGGDKNDLLTAINACRYHFMNDPQSWKGDETEAEAMYAFLVSLPPEVPSARPFTVRGAAVDLPAGDAARGGEVYRLACQSCHGAPTSGQGRLLDAIPVLPEQSVAYFNSIGFDTVQTRVTFVEKVRHGGFLGLSGSMPPFSLETMSDEDLAALLSFLKLYQ